MSMSSPTLAIFPLHNFHSDLNFRFFGSNSTSFLLDESLSSSSLCLGEVRFRIGGHLKGQIKNRRELSLRTAALPMFSENPIIGDVVASALSGGIALSSLRVWEETAKRGLFDPKVNRKLVHISIGLIFMLCWPMFSAGHRGAIFAATIPAIQAVKVLLLGFGIWEDEAAVKSMTRFGDRRELLKGPLYYGATIGLACAVYWRTSPISIAAICNLCAGDGMADIIGRRFGHQKLPYNSNKSVVGSISMVLAGFVASIAYMHYFSTFGYIEESFGMAIRFLAVSIIAALVESLPISTQLDDNLTVPLTSVLVASFLFSQ